MVNLSSFLLVFVGGGIGSLFRYSIGIFFATQFKSFFPYGTFMVNIIGCFLLGLVIGLIENKRMLSPEMGILFGTGFCGGFTTFSAFSMEANQMMENGNWLLFVGYTVGSFGVGILFTFLGLKLTK